MEELLGCWQEARRADKVAGRLLHIRSTLQQEFYEHITAVLNEIESTSRLLRDLHDLSSLYRSRIPLIVYYLNVLLPSLQKTLQQMTIYVEAEGTSRFKLPIPLGHKCASHHEYMYFNYVTCQITSDNNDFQEYRQCQHGR
jgi:hypothetical protein